MQFFNFDESPTPTKLFVSQLSEPVEKHPTVISKGMGLPTLSSLLIRNPHSLTKEPKRSHVPFLALLKTTLAPPLYKKTSMPVLKIKSFCPIPSPWYVGPLPTTSPQRIGVKCLGMARDKRSIRCDCSLKKSCTLRLILSPHKTMMQSIFNPNFTTTKGVILPETVSMRSCWRLRLFPPESPFQPTNNSPIKALFTSNNSKITKPIPFSRRVGTIPPISPRGLFPTSHARVHIHWS